MLELVAIFTTGGIVLFYKAFALIKTDIIDCLIKKIMIQDRKAETSLLEEPFRLHWSFANKEGLVFVAVHREVFQMEYVADLLEILRQEYTQHTLSLLKTLDNIITHVPSFEEGFQSCY